MQDQPSRMKYVLIALISSMPFSVDFGDDEKEAYVDKWTEIARIESQRTGIPASIILGQAILETSYGKSRLSTEAKNHFGIKCKKNWEGKVFYTKDDDKDEHGNLIDSCFRAYNNDYDSFIDHSHFMMRSPCYRFLLDYKKSEYHKWAKGIASCGYATDPRYDWKLINLIEKHQLWHLDVED